MTPLAVLSPVDTCLHRPRLQREESRRSRPNTKPQETFHVQDHTGAEQGPRSRSLRHTVQQARLRRRRTFWSDRYIQHSAHIAPSRDGLFNLIRSLPNTLRYENQLIVAEGDYVIAHGRFSGTGRAAAWVAADIVRIEDGRLAEHWDVLQDEATKAQSLSGLPMFGDRFPA